MSRRTVIVGLLVAVLIAAVAAVSLPMAPSARQDATTPIAPARPESSSRDFAPSTTQTPGNPPSPLSGDERAALADSVSTAVSGHAPGSKVGLAVYDRLAESVVAEINADEQFYTASVVKLLIVTDSLRDAGWALPRGQHRENLVALLSRSADWVASSLWAAGGGPVIVTETAELIGLEATVPPRIARQWEMTRTTPRDVLAVYDYLTTGMPEAAREFVLNALGEATRVAADGFDQFFGIPAALPDSEWAIKQGWMRVDNGIVLNTTGTVGPRGRYHVVLLTLQPPGTSFATARSAVTAGVAALAPALTEAAG
ncbi:hypothetical protein SacmaDRAFT_3720 [Saccharomonospora marina XMU15]|uniref:Beta-lactamase class A n=1 Tax=Saccharomonospora marina XMU15 TaxID=882083 RepID=H5X0T3_9PSEU|nr:hypothetical protein [Saccharomonospora marina]EHR51933.1 hypothetical protein SacmaDRAFT_3720 [Saccharomonospora marina XMU15]